MVERAVRLRAESGWSSRSWSRGVGVWLALVVLVLVAAVGTDTFLRPLNLSNVSRQAVALGLISIGQTVVILSGGIDMSVGSLVSLSGVLVAGLTRGDASRIVPALLAVLATALAVGVVNALVVAQLRVAPFIATLGTMSAVQAATFLYTREPVGPVAWPLRAAAERSVAGVPLGAVVALGLAAGCAWALRHTTLGRHLYAVGSYEEGAALAGVRVRRVRAVAYIISAVFAAAAGVWLAGRMSIGDPIVGSGFELYSITAVLIGGTSLAGGRGGMWGTVAGVLLITVLNNVMNLFNISSFIQQILQGLILLVAVLWSSDISGQRQRGGWRDGE